MKMSYAWGGLLALIVAAATSVFPVYAQGQLQTAALKSLIKDVDQNNRAVINEEYAASLCFIEKASTPPCKPRGWDIMYGSLRIGDSWDSLMVPATNDNRTRFMDLGLHSWKDRLRLCSLEPYPVLQPGERRPFVADASGSAGAAGLKDGGTTLANTPKSPKTSDSTTFVLEGHVYLFHIVSAQTDYYVLMRADKLVRGSSLGLSWKRIRSPRPCQ